MVYFFCFLLLGLNGVYNSLMDLGCGVIPLYNIAGFAVDGIGF